VDSRRGEGRLVVPGYIRGAPGVAGFLERYLDIVRGPVLVLAAVVELEIRSQDRGAFREVGDPELTGLSLEHVQIREEQIASKSQIRVRVIT
jgi:hypothetical protein